MNTFFKENPRLEQLYLPPISPQLNQIEGLCKWLKETCINNVFF
ncbi:transposase [Enterococcus aquimarinus]